MNLPPSISRVLVVGLGRVTGKAVAEALVERGLEVRVTEATATDEHLATASALQARGVEVTFGPPAPELVDWADLIVPSPGVPPGNPVLTAAAARGRRIWSEIELGSRFTDADLIAVTGTNGKTTTTSLLARILEHAGLPSVAAGNIGFPLIDAASSATGSARLVCEVSSFQLAYIDSFRPAVAIVLNVAHDHFDWHEGYEDYLRAKARITENQTAEDLLIVALDDPGCIEIAQGSQARIGGFGPGEPAELKARGEDYLGRRIEAVAGTSGGQVVVDLDGRASAKLDMADIRLQGRHNVENVQAAVLGALSCGASPRSISEGVRSFEGLPHRTAFVKEIDGVAYIDDSKATNPHATLKAVAGLDNVVLIAGGRAKGLDLSVLRGIKPQLSGIVVMGEAASELKELFQEVRCEHAATVEDAVMVAAGIAKAGDTVLLSPACSSLDQYSDYAERGRRFAEAVRSL